MPVKLTFAQSMRELLSVTPARELPPDPEEMNDKRAQAACDALIDFARAHGETYVCDTQEDAKELAAQNLSDLLGDMAHLCDRSGLCMSELLRRAKGHYDEETFDDSGVSQGVQEFFAA